MARLALVVLFALSAYVMSQDIYIAESDASQYFSTDLASMGTSYTIMADCVADDPQSGWSTAWWVGKGKYGMAFWLYNGGMYPYWGSDCTTHSKGN